MCFLVFAADLWFCWPCWSFGAGSPKRLLTPAPSGGKRWHLSPHNRHVSAVLQVFCMKHNMYMHEMYNPDMLILLRLKKIPHIWFLYQEVLIYKGTHSQSRIWKFVFVKIFDFQKSMIFQDPHWNQIICKHLFDRKHFVFMKLWYKNNNKQIVSWMLLFWQSFNF